MRTRYLAQADKPSANWNCRGIFRTLEPEVIGMLSFAGNLRVFVAVEPCDMRKSFNGLHAVVVEKLREDPTSGALFAFTNKRRNRLKLLYWDGSGLWVLAKRLEEGHFSWPQSGKNENIKIKLAPEALSLLMDGIDMREGCRLPWYQRE